MATKPKAKAPAKAKAACEAPVKAVLVVPGKPTRKFASIAEANTAYLQQSRAVKAYVVVLH